MRTDQQFNLEWCLLLSLSFEKTVNWDHKNGRPSERNPENYLNCKVTNNLR